MDEFNQSKRQHFVEYYEKSGVTSVFLQTWIGIWDNFVTSMDEKYLQTIFCPTFANSGPRLDKISMKPEKDCGISPETYDEIQEKQTKNDILSNKSDGKGPVIHNPKGPVIDSPIGPVEDNPTPSMDDNPDSRDEVNFSSESHFKVNGNTFLDILDNFNQPEGRLLLNVMENPELYRLFIQKMIPKMIFDQKF